MTLAHYVVREGDSARSILAAFGRSYSAGAWRELVTANRLTDTLEKRLAFYCAGSMPTPGALLEAPCSWECPARDDGGHGAPRCFWRLRSPGPLGPDGLPASGPLCEACDRAVSRVLSRGRS